MRVVLRTLKNLLTLAYNKLTILIVFRNITDICSASHENDTKSSEIVLCIISLENIPKLLIERIPGNSYLLLFEVLNTIL